MIYIPIPIITNAIAPAIIYVIVLSVDPVGGVILTVIVSSSCVCNPTVSNVPSVKYLSLFLTSVPLTYVAAVLVRLGTYVPGL